MKFHGVTNMNRLTKREYEVLQRAALTACDIANELAITEGTVNNHFGNIFRKLNAKNKIEAVLVAIKTRVMDVHSFRI